MKLQRYNELLFATIGTVALLAVLVGIASELWPVRDHGLAGVQLERPESVAAKSSQTLEFCEPREASGTQFEYFPVAVVDQSNAERDPHVAGGYGYGFSAIVAGSGGRYLAAPGCDGGSARRVTNVVIQNVVQGTERLLLDAPGLIDSVSLPAADCANGKGPVPCGIAIWMLRREDSNGDGTLNALDVRSTWASDLDGQNLRRLTPEMTSTEDFHWLTESNRLVIRVRADTNGNGRYTDEDGVQLLVTSATHPSMATEAIGAETLARLQQAIR